MFFYSHDSKSAHVSFSFKKNIGSRITSTQPFRREEKKASPEIRLLQPETEPRPENTDTPPDSAVDSSKESELDESVEKKIVESELEEKVARMPVLSSFVKVQSKDDNGKVLDWPKEMLQYTTTEPKLMYSCNPLSFDFSSLFNLKPKKATVTGLAELCTSTEVDETETDKKPDEEIPVKAEENVEVAVEEKKKSHKKKKKKKHKKSSEKVEGTEDGKEKADKPAGEEINTSTSSSKKKKKKHKKKEKKDVEKDDKPGEAEDKEEKKSKKSKKKSKQSDGEAEKNEDGSEKKQKKKKKKSKKKKRKVENGQSEAEAKPKGETDSEKESDGEKDKDLKKRKKKKRKHKKRDISNHESSDSEPEAPDVVKEQATVVAIGADATNSKRKFPGGDSDADNDKIVAAKLQALSRTKTVQKQITNNVILTKKIKKEPSDLIAKTTPSDKSSDRKRLNSESSVTETTGTPAKKQKVTPKATGLRDNIPVATIAPVTSSSNLNIKVEKEELCNNTNKNLKMENEESWSKIETQTTDNVKSKWDTSESDMDNALDQTVKKEKVLKKRLPAKSAVKPQTLKTLKSPPVRGRAKPENEVKKTVQASTSKHTNSSSKRTSHKGHHKSRKTSKSPASSGSRSRSKHRSYSRSGSSSRSRSYSSSSYYSDDSRHSRRHRRSSSRSYSGSSSRSRSRSYRRRRSSSYSDYSRSRSYSTSRSRSRSHRRRKRSYTRSRTRSYSSSSYSSHSRSRNRYRKSRRKNRRKRRSNARSLSVSSLDKAATKKTKVASVEKAKDPAEKEKVVTGPLDIPLPDLSGKKDDERTEEKLAKLKDKKPRTDVGETVAKLVESLPADIPLPFSEGDKKTVSSDSLPHGSPKEALRESDTGFIGPKMPGAPPPPPGMGMGGQRFPPNHGPPGPPRPNYGPGQWDHWDPHGWDMPGPWDGPGPGPRPYRGMRPYDPRMYGPYDPRRRGPPPHFMNRPRGPPPYGMGPRYPGPRGPHPDYPHDYDYDGQAEYKKLEYQEEELKQNKSPPPLPKEPPKEESPKPPLPKKVKKELEQNPDIVIPPEQVEQYKVLQKQAAKHARRQLRRQAKKELGEPDDSTSSESEPEEQPIPDEQIPTEEEIAMMEEAAQPQLVALPQQVVIAQPQPTASPSGAYVIVSGGQQFIVQQRPTMVQSGIPMQAGQPVVAQGASVMATAAAAAAGAHPAHLVQQVPMQGHIMSAGGVPLALASQAHLQQIQQAHQLQQIQQIQQMQQLQQLQQIQQIQAHNQAVAMAHAQSQGPILVGNQILVPRIVRPAI